MHGLLALERCQMSPSLRPLLLSLLCGVDMSVKLRAVLPPWHWASSGPRVELGGSFLFGLHPWPSNRNISD